jgi:dihydropyrimidinase
MGNAFIKNCTIVNPDRTFDANIYVKDDFVEQIGVAGTLNIEEKRTIDGTGKFLIPAGIDPHVHLQLPTPAGPSCDDFKLGSFAALMGGTGAMIDFVTPARGESLIEALDKREHEAITSVIPHKLHVGITWWNKSVAEEIQQCIEDRGITSFKVYLAYRNTIGLDFAGLKEVMQCLSNYNAVLAVHAEEGDRIQQMQNTFVINGKLEPKYHAYSRPADTEYNAVKKVIDLVRETGCKTYFVHMSTAESVRLIRDAKKERLPVFAETCPQYLLLDESVYEQYFIQVFPYIISPPIRGAADREELWKGLSDGTIDCVSTDHCPFTLRQKMEGRFDFTKIPNGAGGLHHRMSLLYTHGVMQNKISMQQFVQLTSSNAAKIFGFENYGYVKAGIESHLILWNPEYKHTISFKDSLTNADISIYDDFEVYGIPEKNLISYQ